MGGTSQATDQYSCYSPVWTCGSGPWSLVSENTKQRPRAFGSSWCATTYKNMFSISAVRATLCSRKRSRIETKSAFSLDPFSGGSFSLSYRKMGRVVCLLYFNPGNILSESHESFCRSHTASLHTDVVISLTSWGVSQTGFSFYNSAQLCASTTKPFHIGRY